MSVSLKIETDRPKMVESYLSGVLQQMMICKHFSIKDWEIEEKTEKEGMVKTSGNLITVRNIKLAETIKLFENIYRDVNIALANEFALFCEKFGIDFIEAKDAANTQPYCYLPFPGIVSGSITKDPYLLINEAENINAKLRITSLARKINDEMLSHTLRMTRKAVRLCKKTLKRAKISVFGVSNQPNIKDAQDSLTMELTTMLKKRGVKVRVYDPFFTQKELKDLGYPTEKTLTKTVEGADCLIFVVGHKKFERINLKRIKYFVKNPAVIIDMSRIILPKKAEKEGFKYLGVGRGV